MSEETPAGGLDDAARELARLQSWTGTEALVEAIAHDLNNELGVILNHGSFLIEDAASGSAAGGDAQAVVDAARQAVVLSRQLGLIGRVASAGAQVRDLGTLVEELEPVLGRGLGEGQSLQLAIGSPTGVLRAGLGAVVRALLALVSARAAELDVGATLLLSVGADAEGAYVHVEGPARAFDPWRAGACGLAGVAGGRLERKSAAPGHAALAIIWPVDDG
jgi:signal transduction histidine kinase